MDTNQDTREPDSWKQAIRFIFLVVTLVLPFVLQKAHLDATRGGGRPELANFASPLVPLSFLLPFVAVFFLPLAWQGRLALAVVLTPIFFLVFGYFTVDYACTNYNGYCF